MMRDTAPVLIIGSGIAGLLTALKLAKRGVASVVATKSRLHHNSSWWAQGGIAAVLPENQTDSLAAHVEDTLFAGAGLADEPMVRSILGEGAQAIDDLIELGVPFDRQGDKLAFTKEAAHTQSRILHAGGDATGRSIQQVLIDLVNDHPLISVLERCIVSELLVKDGQFGQCVGAMAVTYDDLQLPTSIEPKVILAPYTVLATGGLGQLYQQTTNPPIATADGIALAYKAGATIQDMEFVQFHPTGFWANGQVQFLISEALRGEGGILIDEDGHRFAFDHHQLGELAPRDIVTRAISAQMRHANTPHVWLDISHLPDEQIESRFPTIMAKCAHFGIDIRREPIPVAPAAHYGMGGVQVDARGQTSVANLYGVGEVVSSGLHGANRLASNSLLECVVLGRRVAQDIAAQTTLPAQSHFSAWATTQHRMARLSPTQLHCNDLHWAIEAFRALMWEQVGIIRDANGLNQALKRIEKLWQTGEIEGWFDLAYRGIEFRNMLMTGHLIARAALERQESRGAHYRSDCSYPAAKALHSQQAMSDLRYHQQPTALPA